MALYLAMQEEPFIMVESSEEQAERLLGDVFFFREVLGRKADIYYLPLPDSPSASGQRAEVIHRAFIEGRGYEPLRAGTACHEMGREPLRNGGGSIITWADAASAPLWRPEALKENIVSLNVNAETGRTALEEALLRAGYRAAPVVAEKGEFSLRRWQFDIFPVNAENPIRVEFFGDVIENIRPFDTETQRAPRAPAILALRAPAAGTACHDILPAVEPEEGPDIFALMPEAQVFCIEMGAVPPAVKQYTVLSSYPIKDEGVDAGLIPISGLGILPEERKEIGDLTEAVKGLGRENRIAIVSSSEGQARRLDEIFKDGGLIAPRIEPGEIASYEGTVSISVGGLSSGFFLPNIAGARSPIAGGRAPGLLVLTESELFRRPPYRPLRKSRVAGLLTSLEDLSERDYVVHRDHGIGRFTGLVRQTVEGSECDLMVIEYAGGDKLYLPLHAIEKIHKYASSEGAVPALDRLGGKTWQKTKEKVKKKVREMAERLLRLYAEREVSKGFAFSGDTELHREFDGFFPYEETPDQLRAIEEIKRDMASDRPMDRLLSGDVGYGKTEVAMRAAFKAVYDGKQVAVIVPTTLLCDQHLRTFRLRFSAFPVRIDYLSRFKSRREQLETLKAVARGEVDIIIGTHAILRKDVVFHDLGLLIVDEEHRFGVAQKEKIKELRKGVDVLSMSATPIPRTLQMALSGIRGMSAIETPPEERLAVKSALSVFGESVIREAVERETKRGGQVFLVHNRIMDIEKIAGYLKRLMPALRIEVAHGRMSERLLEKVMLRFVNRDVDVLVSTAIIGSGLDIPNANTIIINMAERMGLADLYQLKGRVGRSNIPAYAYYLIPGEEAVTGEAKKRLQAIKELSYLGAGLRLAMKDLEIRGAGNLLGPEQSGYIEAVGFDMYIEMLEAAVSELRGVEPKEKVETSISLPVSAFIPEDYISDTMLRLTAYRRVALAGSPEEIGGLREEFRDRFGPLPPELENLLKVMALKLDAGSLLIKAVRQADGKLRFIFSEEKTPPAEKILKRFGGRVRFLSDGFELALKGDAFDEARKVMGLFD